MKKEIKEQTNLLLKRYADSTISEKEKRKIENEIIELNIPLLNTLAKKYMQDNTRGLFEDFLQEARFGTLKAIRTYSFDKEISFASYAGVCAENEIRMFIRTFLKTSFIGCAKRDLKIKYGREATVKEICEYKGISEEQYKNYTQGPVSFKNLTYSPDDDSSIGEEIAVEPEDLEEKVIDKITSIELREKIEQLPFRYRYVVKRLALDEATQDMVAEEMHVSRSLVSKDYTKGRIILKQMFAGKLDKDTMKLYGMGTVEDKEMTLATYIKERDKKRQIKYNQEQLEKMRKYQENDEKSEDKESIDNIVEMPNMDEDNKVKIKK